MAQQGILSAATTFTESSAKDTQAFASGARLALRALSPGAIISACARPYTGYTSLHPKFEATSQLLLVALVAAALVDQLEVRGFHQDGLLLSRYAHSVAPRLSVEALTGANRAVELGLCLQADKPHLLPRELASRHPQLRRAGLRAWLG